MARACCSRNGSSTTHGRSPSSPLREGHNDPGRLLESIVRALAEVLPIADDVFVALARPAAVVHEVLDQLEHSLATCDPFVLALDDVQVLEDAESLAALTRVADVIPAGSQLALASRREPALPIGRVRAQCRLVERAHPRPRDDPAGGRGGCSPPSGSIWRPTT